MKPTDLIKENAEDLNIGDPVIITGNVQFKGKTGDIVDFGKDKRFVVVNLYNHGKHSFQSSDVSYNDYAESGDEQEYLSQFEENKTGTIFVGQLKGTDPASKVRDRLVGEARSLQSKFEKHLAKHGYDVNEKQKYWEKKIKDIDAQIAAWDAEMERRKQGKEMTTESNKPKFQVGDHVKFLYMQKPEIWREGRVVGFGRGDMVNVQGERNEYSVHTNLLKKAKQGVTEDEYEDGNEEGFFVAIGSEDAGGFVGMVYKEGGKWREQEVAGNAPYNWGASYMGYLSPGDVMQWIRQDYGRHSHVKGPFDTEEAAFDFASRMYGLGESVSKGLPGSLSRSDYMPGAVRHDLSNIKPKKTGPEWDPDRPVADIDPDWEKEQAAKRKKQRGVAEAKSLAKRVRVVKTGETGTIRQIKHGAYKGAAKTYYVDLDNGGQADNLPASALRLIKDDVAEGSDPTKKVFLKVNAINTGMPKGWHRVRRIELDPQRNQYYVETKPGYGIYCGVENRQTYSLRNGEGMAITVRQADAILNDHQGVAEGSLDEIDRRGFLKGLGAAAIAATFPLGAKAQSRAKIAVEVGELDTGTKEYEPVNSGQSRNFIYLYDSSQFIMQWVDRRGNNIGEPEVFQAKGSGTDFKNRPNTLYFSSKNAVKVVPSGAPEGDLIYFTPRNWIDQKIGWRSLYYQMFSKVKESVKQGVAEEVDAGEYDARKTTTAGDNSQFWARQSKLRKARNKAAKILGYEDMWDMPEETAEWKDLVNKLMRSEQGVAEGGEWDEYTGGAPFPDTDELDTYGGEHDPDDLDESSGTEYREFDIRASREYGTSSTIYWIYYRGRCTDLGSRTLDGAKKDIDRLIANGFFNDPDEEARKKQRGVAEGRVDQLPTKGADYSKYDTAHLKTMLRPGIMHRDEAKFKSLIRKELKKREQQGVAEGGEWDEYTGGAPFPDTDDLDTYGGEHDPDDLNESSGTEYRGFDIRASCEYSTSSTIYWIYYRGRSTDLGNRTLDGAKKNIDRMIANGFFNDPDEEARKKQRGVAEGKPQAKYTVINHRGGVAVESPTGRLTKGFASTSDAAEWAKKKNAELKNKGVAEGEYDPSYDPEYRGYEKPERNVDWDIEAERNAPDEPKSTSTVTVRDNEGNVVLQFPSTGGYYGDLKYAANKGIDLEGGDYHANWQRNEDAMMSEASGVTSEQVASEIVRRIIFKHKDAISAFGPEAIMSAAREVGEFFAGSEELGTSDIGIATKYTLDKLEKMSQGALGESATGGATSAGAVATVPGGGKNVGSLFGGSYKQPKKKKK